MVEIPQFFEKILKPREKKEEPKVEERDAELEKAISKEQEEAKERFGVLIGLVNERYEGPESTLAEDEVERFKEHNSEILNLCVERGMEKGLSEQELRTLEVAATLHDLNKADKPASEVADIPNHVLAAHGEMAADEVPDIIVQHPEVLESILGPDYSEEESDSVVANLQEAIRAHMGPHPGFMDFILAGVNKGLREKGMAEIEHPYPEKGNKVAETLLAADMHSLAGRKGREKVLAIRSSKEKGKDFFRKQDEKLSAEYGTYGIDLTVGEAALLSGFDSADQARDMFNSEDADWVNRTIEASKKGDYDYEGKEINYQDAVAKRETYEIVTKKREIEAM